MTIKIMSGEKPVILKIVGFQQQAASFTMKLSICHSIKLSVSNYPTYLVSAKRTISDKNLYFLQTLEHFKL